MKVTRVKPLIPAPKDGQKLYLVVTPSQLGLDKDSSWKNGSTVTVEVWRQKGNDDPTQSDMGSYTVTVYKNGGSTVHANRSNIPSFTFSASKSDSSYEVVLKVSGKTSDTKTVFISKDGTKGSIVTIIDVNGDKYWAIDGVSTGVKAEGKDGTGVNVQGSVDVLNTADATGTQTSLQGLTGLTKGDCYIVEADRHLYMYLANGQTFPGNWKDLGEFKGAPGQSGQSNYIHLAHATWVDVENQSVTGFTVVAASGSSYSWMGICVDDNPLDPGSEGRPFTNTGQDTAYHRYKWNFIKGKDGDNYEHVYLPTKTNTKPGVNDADSYVEDGQTINKSKDEYRPAVSGYNSSQHRYSRWQDDPCGVSSTWKYEWEAIRKKVDGVWGDFVVSGGPIHIFYRPPFWSRVYKRVAVGTNPGTPSGGSYDSPVPSGWSDGIPDASTVNGDSLVWTSLRKFADDETTQWSSPQVDRDTQDSDIEYAPAQTNDAQPAPPGTDGVTWYDPATSTLPSGLSWSDMVWRAERKMKNGVAVGDWVVTRIKGEKGDPGGRATGLESWFCALDTKLSVIPGITFYSDIPYWTVGGSQKRWYKGQDSNWSNVVPYLYRMDKYQTSDGDTFWGDPFFSAEWADQGPTGPEGPTGNGITGEETYYLVTTMATGVTRSTDAGNWTTNYQNATPDKPYVWRYRVTHYRDTADAYTDCELIFSYNSGANSNLLEQTNFSSLQAMDSWNVRGHVLPVGNSPIANSLQVVTGLQARNAIRDSLSYGKDTVDYEDLLQQIVTGTKRKLEPDTWYTLSFWMKGTQTRQLTASSGGYGFAVSGTRRDIYLYGGRKYRFTVYGYISRHNNYDVSLRTFVWGPLNAGNPWSNQEYEDITGSGYTTATFEFTPPSNGFYGIESYIYPDNKRNGNEYGYVSYYSILDTECLLVTHLYPNIINTDVQGYVDGVLKVLNADGYCIWPESSGWVRHTYTFKTKSNLDVTAENHVLWRIPPCIYAGLTRDVYLCMPKLEVGMQATSYISNEESTHHGQPRRRRWAVNTEYFQGAVDERYDDVVLVGEAGFYHCIKTHISTLDNMPGIGTYWETYWTSAQSGQYENLSTELFFANKALINNLIATLIQTGYSGNPHIEAEGSEFKIFGKGQYPAIYLAVNDQNKAVLRFQNENTGEFLYDLGPDGIMKEFSEVADSYTPMKLKKLTNATRVSELLDITEGACTTYYRFNEGYKQIGSGNNVSKEYHVSGGASPSAQNAQFFTSQNYNGTTIADGWYVKPNNGVYMMKPQDAIGAASIYVVWIYLFSEGKLSTSVPVYFKYTDSQHANHSVGCDENGNELSTSTYTYLYSYAQSQLTP